MRTCRVDNHSAGVAAQTPLHDRNGNLTERRHITERFVNLEEEIPEPEGAGHTEADEPKDNESEKEAESA